MIDLIKYTYLMRTDKVEEELNIMHQKYQHILKKAEDMWDELNEARAILFLIGNVYCESIAIQAIERRLHLLKHPLSLIEFLDLIDKNSEKLEELRKDELFKTLENFYRIIKKYKNKYDGGKYYLNEEKFINFYNLFNPNSGESIDYKGSFSDKQPSQT
ncbi:MAG: hypothetical protein KJ646_01780 [Nanoarchaeota archaeon]|nr:hypothetical protein [Nanoarchaeota archaeon]